MDHTIFNERPESQDRLIRQLVKMGYEYIPRAEAEEKRGHLSKVIFEDVLIRFLMKQQYKYGEFYYNFSPDNIKKSGTGFGRFLIARVNDCKQGNL